MWVCAKTPLPQFDRKGDPLMLTPMHARCIPDADPDAYPDAVITLTRRAYLRTPLFVYHAVLPSALEPTFV